MSITVAPDNIGGFAVNFGPDGKTVTSVRIRSNGDEGVAVVILWASPNN
jgi:hypothetical protein